MAENLNYADKDSKCHDNKPANCTQYGRLYNYETAKKACPKGWHLPRNAEWEKLSNFADSTRKEAGKRLKAKSGWKDTDGKPANGTDDFGFSALPGGYGYGGVGIQGSWWSFTGTQVSITYSDYGYEMPKSKNSGVINNSFTYSIRCVQGDEEEALKADAEENAAKEKSEAEAAAKVKAETEAYVKANGGTFTDTRDKKTYKTIKINGQVWMAENLNYAAENTKCYQDKPENCTQYGRLYNWETAIKSCPAGWHLPKNAEWDKLYRSADGTSGTESPYKSKTAGKFLKAANGWVAVGNKGTSGNGTDKFGFSALPGGSAEYYRDFKFNSIGTSGIWWSSTNNNDKAYMTMLFINDGYTNSQETDTKDLYYSVRCIKD